MRENGRETRARSIQRARVEAGEEQAEAGCEMPPGVGGWRVSVGSRGRRCAPCLKRERHAASRVSAASSKLDHAMRLERLPARGGVGETRVVGERRSRWRHARSQGGVSLRWLIRLLVIISV